MSLLETGYVIDKKDSEDEVIPIPYNVNNIFITEQNVINILKNFFVKIDKVNRLEYIQRSFIHKSYMDKKNIPINVLNEAKQLINNNNLLELQKESYERLEYLGDRVIKITLAEYLFLRYFDMDEGFMTKLQTKLEDKKNLALFSKALGLEKYFIISKQIEDKYGRKLDKIHEDVFEAFIGGLYLSNGLEPCKLLLINMLETLVDYAEKLYCDNNYKDILLRHYHKMDWKSPKYDVIHFEGPAHDRLFLMGVKKNDADKHKKENKYIGYGIGNSKKAGEQKAAKMALIIMDKLNKDQYNNNDIYYPDWKNMKIN